MWIMRTPNKLSIMHIFSIDCLQQISAKWFRMIQRKASPWQGQIVHTMNEDSNDTSTSNVQRDAFMTFRLNVLNSWLSWFSSLSWTYPTLLRSDQDPADFLQVNSFKFIISQVLKIAHKLQLLSFRLNAWNGWDLAFKCSESEELFTAVS